MNSEKLEVLRSNISRLTADLERLKGKVIIYIDGEQHLMNTDYLISMINLVNELIIETEEMNKLLKEAGIELKDSK